MSSTDPPKIPTVERIPVEKKLLEIDRSIVDPYQYFRDKKNPKVLDYIKRENEYYEYFRKSTLLKLENEFYEEMLKLHREDDVSIPFQLQGYYYYKKNVKGLEYPIYYRHKDCPPMDIWKSSDRSFPGEVVLIDMNEEAKGKSHCELGSYEVSTNGRYFAYTIDANGSRSHNLYVKDLEDGGKIVDSILLKEKEEEEEGEEGKSKVEKDNGVDSTIAWANDNKTIFYMRLNDQKRSYQVFTHELFTKNEEDRLVIQEDDEAYYINLSKSLSEKYIFLTYSSQITTEIHMIDLTDENNLSSPPKLFMPRTQDVEVDIHHHDSLGFVLLHNYDHINFHLQYLPEEIERPQNWEDLSKLLKDFDGFHYDSSRFITSIMVLRRFAVLWTRVGGFQEVLVLDWMSKGFKTPEIHSIEFDEKNFDSWINTNYVYDSEFIRLRFSSLVTPISTYDYYVKDRKRVLLKREVREDVFDPSKYASENFYVTSRDSKKTKIPVTLVYKKKTPERQQKKRQPSPCIVYGYAAYGSSNDPYFRRSIVCMLDRGLVYVLVHARGGSEKGREWYEKEGKLMTKKNSIFDVNDVSKFLIDSGWTTPKQLCLHGVSAGGLLAACLNYEPWLYGSAVFDVPFVDLMNTMLDETVPLTVQEWEEWGNPNKVEYFDYMKSYSPYDNLCTMKEYYPNLFLLGNMNDSSVGYWEPLKYAANARFYVNKNRVKCDQIVVRTNLVSGHGGSSGRYENLREYAMVYSWAFHSCTRE